MCNCEQAALPVGYAWPSTALIWPGGGGSSHGGGLGLTLMSCVEMGQLWWTPEKFFQPMPLLYDSVVTSWTSVNVCCHFWDISEFMAEAKIAGCTTTTTIKTQFSHCRASKHLQPPLPSHANSPPPLMRDLSPPSPLNEIFGMGAPPPPPHQNEMADAPLRISGGHAMLPANSKHTDTQCNAQLKMDPPPLARATRKAQILTSVLTRGRISKGQSRTRFQKLRKQHRPLLSQGCCSDKWDKWGSAQKSAT